MAKEEVPQLEEACLMRHSSSSFFSPPRFLNSTNQ